MGRLGRAVASLDQTGFRAVQVHEFVQFLLPARTRYHVSIPSNSLLSPLCHSLYQHTLSVDLFLRRQDLFTC